METWHFTVPVKYPASQSGHAGVVIAGPSVWPVSPVSCCLTHHNECRKPLGSLACVCDSAEIIHLKWTGFVKWLHQLPLSLTISVMFLPSSPPGHFEISCNFDCSLWLAFFFFFLQRGQWWRSVLLDMTGGVAVDVATASAYHLKSSV